MNQLTILAKLLLPYGIITVCLPKSLAAVIFFILYFLPTKYGPRRLLWWYNAKIQLQGFFEMCKDEDYGFYVLDVSPEMSDAQEDHFALLSSKNRYKCRRDFGLFSATKLTSRVRPFSFFTPSHLSIMLEHQRRIDETPVTNFLTFFLTYTPYLGNIVEYFNEDEELIAFLLMTKNGHVYYANGLYIRDKYSKGCGFWRQNAKNMLELVLDRREPETQCLLSIGLGWGLLGKLKKQCGFYDIVHKNCDLKHFKSDQQNRMEERINATKKVLESVQQVSLWNSCCAF